MSGVLFLTAATAAAAAAVTPTIEIALGVDMPRINLGTCCGSEVTNAFPAWWAAGGRGVDTAFDCEWCASRRIAFFIRTMYAILRHEFAALVFFAQTARKFLVARRPTYERPSPRKELRARSFS
jgi:hypothetical protein